MALIKSIRPGIHGEALSFAACIWAITIFSLCQSEWSRLHMGLSPDWFSMSFYFFIPAALWTMAFPLVRNINQKFDLHSGRLRNWIYHAVFSIVLAVAIRFLALLIDFLIKDIPVTFFEFLYTIRFLFVSSALDNFVIYWMLLGALYAFNYRERLATGRETTYSEFKRKKNDSGINGIAAADVHFIEAFGNYLKVHTSVNITCIRGTIKSASDTLDPRLFTQVHRSFIVNRSQIKLFKPGRTCSIELKDGRNIVVGVRFREKVARILGSQRG